LFTILVTEAVFLT